MSGERSIKMLGVRPAHPGRGEPSYIQIAVVLSHLKGEPVVTTVLSPAEAIRMIEQLAQAIRVTELREV
jgi:hypothetical protein